MKGLLLTIILLFSLMLCGVLDYAESSDSVPYDYVFEGPSPPIAESNSVLILNTDAKTFGFYSIDSVIGEISIDVTAPQYWQMISNDPPRLIFRHLGVGGALVQGNVLLGSYAKAVIDVTQFSRRVRYLLKPGCACLACFFPSLREAPAGLSVEVAGTMRMSAAADMGDGVTKYYFLGIANEETDSETNDDIVAWLKKFSNWKDLKLYSGEANADKSAPIWLFDNQNGKQIGDLLEDFKNAHALTKNDVFIFYYAGHMSTLKDENNDEEGGDDAVLFKKGSNLIIRDDELATKVQAIGADDQESGLGTLRIVVFDTCKAEDFWTGKKDINTVNNIAYLYSSGSDQYSYTPSWHDSIQRVKEITEIDKGHTFPENECQEDTGNGQVTFEEWAHWAREIAKAVVLDVPGYKWANMTCDVWKRVVLKK